MSPTDPATDASSAKASPPGEAERAAGWIWQQAADLAAQAHLGQMCPGSDIPYFSHPARVAMVVSAVFGCHDPEVLAAAYLHDVLEKTSVRAEDLHPFGPRVKDWVELLSKNARGPKKEYWARLAGAPWQVRLIKMADALDHLNGPPEYTPDRLKTARKALALDDPAEPDLVEAAAALADAIRALENSHVSPFSPSIDP